MMPTRARSGTLAATDDMEGAAPESYCVWTPGRSSLPHPSRPSMSGSTGSMVRWRRVSDLAIAPIRRLQQWPLSHRHRAAPPSSSSAAATAPRAAHIDVVCSSLGPCRRARCLRPRPRAPHLCVVPSSSSARVDFFISRFFLIQLTCGTMSTSGNLPDFLFFSLFGY